MLCECSRELCSFFFFTTNPKVELSDGNWKEIERVEVNLEEKEDVKSEKGIEHVNQQTNGGIAAEVNGTANMESKDIISESVTSKVWH